MKAIFKGTLADGLALVNVVEDDVAAVAFAEAEESGKTVGMLDVGDPSTIDKGAIGVDPNGTAFVVYDQGLGNGYQVFGPFENDDVAQQFAEKNRDEDDEWEIFVLNDQPEAVMEILINGFAYTNQRGGTAMSDGTGGFGDHALKYPNVVMKVVPTKGWEDMECGWRFWGKPADPQLDAFLADHASATDKRVFFSEFDLVNRRDLTSIVEYLSRTEVEYRPVSGGPGM